MEGGVREAASNPKLRPPTLREGAGNGIHLVLQHLGMQSGDVEWLHGVRQAASEHGIHVHPSACGGAYTMKVNIEYYLSHCYC